MNVRIVESTEYDVQISHADVVKKQGETAISFVEAAKMLASEVDIHLRTGVKPFQLVYIDRIGSQPLT